MKNIPKVGRIVKAGITRHPTAKTLIISGINYPFLNFFSLTADFYELECPVARTKRCVICNCTFAPNRLVILTSCENLGSMSSMHYVHNISRLFSGR